MSDAEQIFLQESRRLLTREYLPKIERCLDRLSDDEIWSRPNEASNSIGNLVLHLCGNVTQWILGGVGGRDYRRERQQEFDERRAVPASELAGRLRAVIRDADAVLGEVNAGALLRRLEIQGYRLTTLEAIYHVVEHFSMHTGQIILVTKAATGEDLRLWEPPQ
jgi:uncharacterized damage-inducible protein DinB